MRCTVIRKLGFLFSILFLISGSVLAQGWQVTPGEGVGALTLGMTSGQVKAILNPSEVVGSEKNPIFIKYGDELLMQYEAGKVVMISLHNSSFKTKNGSVSWVPYNGAVIGAPWTTVSGQIPGTKESRQIKTAKGYPEEFYHAYKSLGLGFRTKAGNIVQIDVWPRR